MNELEAAYGNQIEFVAYNIDDPASTAAKEQYGFRYQPHFLLLDANGNVVEQWFGYNSPNVFSDAFDHILTN